MNASIRKRMFAAGFAALGLTLTACATSSHKSVSTYESNDQGKPAPPAQETERTVDEGEYHMVAPGEMVVEPKKK